MLKVENICKTYDDKKVLNNLSFTVPEGEIYTLVGAFGEGKSTLINILAGFVKPDSGHIYVKGTDCQLSVDKARTLYGYVPDVFPSYGNMTLKEYMIFFGTIMDILDREQINHLSVNLLEFVGLHDYINVKIRKVNYGQKQKLSIARALLHNPKLIVLDEPFYGLNVDQVVEIKEILEFLHKQGRTIFMTSDNLQLSASLSTSVGIMENGSMLYGERTKAAYNNIISNSRQVFTKHRYSEDASITQMTDMGMTSNIPQMEVNRMADMGMTSNIPYRDINQMRVNEPIRMPYDEIQNIERTKNGENISRRIFSKRIENSSQENNSNYDGRKDVSKRGIEEKRGVGGSRVVTDKSKYNNRSK